MATTSALTKVLFGEDPSMSSKASIERQRRIADMLANGQYVPNSGALGSVAMIANALASRQASSSADQSEASRNKALSDLLVGNKTPQELEAAGIGMGAPELLDIAGNRQQQANADRSFGLQQDEFGFRKSQAAADNAFRDKSFNADQANANRAFGFQQNRANVADAQWQKEFDANQSKPIEVNGVLVDPKTYQPVYSGPPKLTDIQANYQAAVAQGYKGSLLDYQLELKKAGATNVNVGGEPALSKELSKNEGKAWSGYLDSATTSAGSSQDMQLLDELIKVAPQGPVTGRLAQMIPGASSAGAAFQSIVNRVAPTLRAPGSGATSDIEYEGMLKSLPSLSNMPEANNAISAMMKAKAQINIERGQIVAAYQNKQISDQEARARLQEINKRSIMTPELQSVIGALGGKSTAPDAEIDMLLEKYK